MRNKTVLVSLFIILAWTILALFSDQILPFNYHQMGPLLDAPPGAADPSTGYIHWLGTDNLGRDLLSRLLSGTRLSLTIGLAADSMITVIGVIIGLVSGYFGGLVDTLLMRFTDIMYAFPGLVFAMVMVAILGRSVGAVLIALGISNWVSMARLVRGYVLQIKQMEYVLAAQSVGTRPFGIMFRHLLPNIAGPVIVLSTLTFPGVVTAEAALAFLNVGVDLSLPTLGGLINYGWDNITSHPTEIAFPILTLAMLTFAFTLLGDSLRDALDPHLR